MDLTANLHPADSTLSVDDFNTHTADLDSMDRLNKDIEALKEQFLRMGVRSHLLEIELATQFSPDLMAEYERAYLNCQESEQAVEEEELSVESSSSSGCLKKISDCVNDKTVHILDLSANSEDCNETGALDLPLEDTATQDETFRLTNLMQEKKENMEDLNQGSNLELCEKKETMD